MHVFVYHEAFPQLTELTLKQGEMLREGWSVKFDFF